MALYRKHSINTFLIKTLWILYLVFHESNLVLCDELRDDSLKRALEAVERRQRDLELQENEFYGQPENIGYGFQKTLGFFDNNGPASELGSFDSNPKNDYDLQNMLYNYMREDDNEKRKSNFRERSNLKWNYLMNDREELTQNGIEYLQMLKNLWTKNRQSKNDDFNMEEISDEQAQKMLNSLYERGPSEERFDDEYGNGESNFGFEESDEIPVRYRKNYRVFEGLSDRKKRYPSFGEGIYGKRNSRNLIVNYESSPENDFYYSVKHANPEFNREVIENWREGGFEDDKDNKLIRILNALNRSKNVKSIEPLLLKEQNAYDDRVWLQGPVTFADDWYEDTGKSEKRMEVTPRYFKASSGILLNSKRLPVKRDSVRVRKEAKNDNVLKEVKEIFGTTIPSTVPPKKGSGKKPTEMIKKQNITKPAVTKHYEGKKVVRSTDKRTITMERPFPFHQNKEISNLFNVEKKSVSKKSIDWSKYFGIDKRNGENWLKNDYLKRSESHLSTEKNKHFSYNGNDMADSLRNQMPFDTRKFVKKGSSYDIGNNIDKVESKIGDIEEKIIDDALKYTGAHSEGKNEDLSKVKSKVIQHLEAAYNLEKMKNALEEFKNLIKISKPANVEFIKSATEAPKEEPRTTVTMSKENSSLEKPISGAKEAMKNSKRIEIQKGVKDIFSKEAPENLEFLNEDAYTNRLYDFEECPVLDNLMGNCQRIGEMDERFTEILVPLCSLQQLCYVCGPEIGFSKMSMCDSMYLTEAQNICQENSECLLNARDSLVALKESYEQDLNIRSLSVSCLSNPCVQKYFLSRPGSIYSMQVQN